MPSPEIKLVIDTSQLEDLVSKLEELLESVVLLKADIEFMRETLHSLGNAISGKIGVKESEIIIRQIIEEQKSEMQ